MQQLFGNSHQSWSWHNILRFTCRCQIFRPWECATKHPRPYKNAPYCHYYICWPCDDVAEGQGRYKGQVNEIIKQYQLPLHIFSFILFSFGALTQWFVYIGISNDNAVMTEDCVKGKGTENQVLVNFVLKFLFTAWKILFLPGDLCINSMLTSTAFKCEV